MILKEIFFVGLFEFLPFVITEALKMYRINANRRQYKRRFCILLMASWSCGTQLTLQCAWRTRADTTSVSVSILEVLMQNSQGSLWLTPHFLKVWFKRFNTYLRILTGFKSNLCMENSDTVGTGITSTELSVRYAWPPLLFYCFKSCVPL